MRIAAVVVTYNRIKLLKECIDRLMTQSVLLDKIIIIDNNSTDQTREYLDTIQNEQLDIIHLKENIGGAGGFNYGLKYATRLGMDYVWLMDDDTIPYSNTLEELIKGIESIHDKDNLGFICSHVEWLDATSCFMNAPPVSKNWNEFLSRGLISVKGASFVSILFPSNVIYKVGLPIKDFFIWSDDAEYTNRIVEKYKFNAYCAINSKVVHKMQENKPTNIAIAEEKRVDRYFYSYRNSFYTYRRRGAIYICYYLLNFFKMIFKITFTSSDCKFKRIRVMFKGFFAGLVFFPKVEHIE